MVAVVCGLLVVGIGASSQAVAQEKQASSRRSVPHYLSLDHLDAYLELQAEYSRTRVRTDSRQFLQRDHKQKNRQRGFEQRFGLSLSGAALDPRFITYSADLSFGLSQDRFTETVDSQSQTDRDRGYLLQYDTRLNFFQGKPLSGSAYALRQDGRINRRFQSTLDEQRSGFGTDWSFAHDRFPMELSYDYLETDRTGNRDKRDDEHFTESTFHYGVDWLIAEHHHVKLSFEHANTKQEFQGLRQSFETTRDLLTLEHEWEFGEDDKNSFRTLIHWQEESGDFARDFFEIGPQLTLQHGENLQTQYKYQFNRERFEGVDIETQRLDFQMIHQLFGNLITTADAFALFEDVEDDVNTTQYGGSVDFQYNRKNRFGHLYANLAIAYDTEEARGHNGRRVVLNEAGTFRDPLPVILRNPNVTLPSIVVTDASNRRIFLIGADYYVVRRGTYTLLVRNPSGRIPDRGTVLIDYAYRTPTDGQLDTIRTDFSLEQRFSNGWTPYYRLSYRNQEDDNSTGFARRADRTNHHRLGVNYEKKRYTLGFEYEIFDDTVDPFDAYHLHSLFHLLQHPDHTVDLSGRFSRLFFEGGFDRRNVTLLDVELDHRWRLSETLSTLERVTYRFEADSVDGDTRGWDVSAGVEHVLGNLSSELTLEYNKLELSGSDEEDVGIYFRIRREIPDVLASR